MLISFIVPMFNVEDYIIQALESINAQQYTNWECIIVNDGSTDNSPRFTTEYIKDKGKFKLVHQKNQGSGIARNTGLGLSSGEYICFLDPDDCIAPTALENNVEILKKNYPDVLANGYFEKKKYKVVKNKPLLEGYFYKSEFIEKFNLYRLVGESSLWNKLYKASFLNENNISFTNQRVGQDTLFNYEVYKQLDSVYIDKNAYYYYNTGRAGSAVNSYKEKKIEFEENIATSFHNLIKHWDKEEQYKKELQLLNWRIIFNEILNINMKDSPLSLQQKKKRIIKLLENHEYNQSIHTLKYQDISSGIGKISLYLLKRETFTTLNNLIMIYLKVYR